MKRVQKTKDEIPVCIDSNRYGLSADLGTKARRVRLVET
jgi:hypothetical protein